MAFRLVIAMLVVISVSGLASAQTVTMSLNSSNDGQTVAPGATIDWEISCTVSPGDNAGLALLVCDLTQDAGNPETLDIPPATGVPAGMTNFSRPDGVTNPGESDPTNGYTGVQRGTLGGQNLIQIGGAQNTTGNALSPGTGMGENANVVGGVGQSGSQVLASGTFTAPATDGSYTFSIDNAVANTLQTVNSPPNHSPVDAAVISYAAQSISFTVSSSTFALGDMNCDGSVDTLDIGPFVLALIDPAQYNANHPTCDIDLADCNTDTSNDGIDIESFTQILAGS